MTGWQYMLLLQLEYTCIKIIINVRNLFNVWCSVWWLLATLIFLFFLFTLILLFFLFLTFFKVSFQPQIVLNLFLFFGRFEPHCSYKSGLLILKKVLVVDIFEYIGLDFPKVTASNKHGVVIKKDRPQTDLFQAPINVWISRRSSTF